MLNFAYDCLSQGGKLTSRMGSFIELFEVLDVCMQLLTLTFGSYWEKVGLGTSGS